MLFLCVWHANWIEAPWQHLYAWRDSFICGTWLIHACYIHRDKTSGCSNIYLWECVWCEIHMCDMTHSYVLHLRRLELLISGSDSIHLCDLNYLMFPWPSICMTWFIHNSFKCVTRFIHTWQHSYVWRDNKVTIHMRDMTHSYVWHDSSTRVKFIEAWAVM